ncbi:MAG: hypothetical protein SPL08_02890 [Pseudomonadota bacterium]|nr:hypothetical protein [Pseudomonadota bacterium]
MFFLFKNNFCLAITTLMAAILIGMVSMIAVYHIPLEPITANISNHFLNIYQKSSHWAPKYPMSNMDYFSDTIILSGALFPTKKELKVRMKDAMLVPHFAPKRIQSLVNYSSGKSKNFFRKDYPRYWHGNLVIFKPLLAFFTVSDIRVLNMVIQTFLLCILMISLYVKGGYKLSIPFLAGALILNPVGSVLSLTSSCMYYITLLSCLIFIKKDIYYSSKYWYFFFLTGIVTVFFDFFTYPLVSLGIPLVFFAILNHDDCLVKIKKIAISTVCWVIGYAGMWIGKLCVGSIILGKNLFFDAINQIIFRLGKPSDTISHAIVKNLNELYYSVPVLIGSMIIMIAIMGLLLKKYKMVLKKSIVIPLLFIGTYPFIWCSIIKKHVIIHSWETHRIFSITILALIYSIVYSISKVKNTKTGETS